MNIHPQAQGLLEGIASQGGPPLTDMAPADARMITVGVAEMIGPGPEVETVREVTIPVDGGEIHARVYEPSADPVATVVYFHGGGWVIGSVDDWDALTRALAVASGARVVSVDYRLAPEHPFPAAADDAYASLLWTAENLADGRPLMVAGDSAGGNLATVCALRARDESGPKLALQVLIYPVVDHDTTGPCYREFTDTGLILNQAEMVWFWDHYVPNAADRSHPHASPLRAADHSGLPPAYVVIAGNDPLRDEGLAYAAKLEAAGVPVTVRRFDDQIHAFYSMVNVLDSANEAIAETGDAIRAAAG